MLYSVLTTTKTIYGRINEVLPEIPVYMSDTSRKITETVFAFSKDKGKFTRDTLDLIDGLPVTIGDITVIPHIVDHSAYGAFMFEIRAEGKKILHTGDFRNHGYKGKLLPKTLQEIGKIDLLITEGTTLSREQVKSQSEKELAIEMAKITDRYKQVLVLMSTTNIDRCSVIQSVATRTNKTVIHDLLLENVLKYTTQKIPNALNSNNVGVFMPSYLYRMRNKTEFQPYIEPYKEKIRQTAKILRKRKFHYERENIYVTRYRETKVKKWCIR